jgi:hypothetical protein
MVRSFHLNQMTSKPFGSSKNRQDSQSLVDFTYYLFTLHYSLKNPVDFWEVIGNSE